MRKELKGSLFLICILLSLFYFTPFIPQAKALNFDYTSFSEIDAYNRISIIDSSNIAFNSIQDLPAYCYKSYETTGDFEYWVEATFSSVNNQGSCVFWQICQELGSSFTHGVFVAGTGYAGYVNLECNERDGGWNNGTGGYHLTYNIKYYFTIKRVGFLFTVQAYTNYARTLLVNTMALTLNSVKTYPYIIAAASWTYIAPGWDVTGLIYNLSLKGGEGFSLSLPDLEGCGNWIFAQEKFYTFNLSATHAIAASDWDYVGIYFQDGSSSYCTIVYDISANIFKITSGGEVKDKEAALIRYQQPKTPILYATDNKTIHVDFELWFTDKITDVYGSNCVDVYAWGNFTGGESGGAGDEYLVSEDAFQIYNRGGFSLGYDTWQDAGRFTGGDVFDFYANGFGTTGVNSWVYDSYAWRNLQHVKLMQTISCRVAYPSFKIYYGMDYCTPEKDWISGWYVVLTPINITVPRITGAEIYWAWTADWYFGEAPGVGYHYDYIKTDTFFTFPEGNPTADGEYAYTRIWVDLWFNLMNASSTWGGRVNSYYYPCHDSAPGWMRVLSTNWGADDTKQKESLCFGRTLDDASGNIIQTQQIKLVRVWGNLTVYGDDALTQKVAIFRPDIFDLTFCNPPLIGIQTPAFDETKMPSLNTGGFLGMLYSGFMAIGKWLAENIIWGGLNLWGNFVGFLDSIAAMFGAPHFFTDLFANIATTLGYIIDAFLTIAQMLYQIFLLIGSLLASFVDILGQLITSALNTITIFQGMIGGTVAGASNLWNDLGIASWITVALIFYPLYLIFLWEDQGMDAVIQQLTWIFGIVSWLFNFGVTVITFLIDMVTQVIESIPVVE